MPWRSGRPKAQAVSLRRLAQELGVTPMALYRHVRDKQDLINAMTEAVLEGIDPTVGFRPEMTWTERMRLAIDNYKEQIDARPLALPLSIAYSGMGPPPSGRRSRTSWPSCSMRALSDGRRSFSSA